MWLSRSSRSRCHEFKSWPSFLTQNNPTSLGFVHPKWPLGVNPTFLRLRKNASQWNFCSETIDQVGGGVRKKRQKFRLRFRDHGFDTCYFENWLGEIFFFTFLAPCCPREALSLDGFEIAGIVQSRHKLIILACSREAWLPSRLNQSAFTRLPS